MAKNYLTAEIKAGIVEAFEQAVGVKYLLEIARRYPLTFCQLLAKVIPAEVKAEVRRTDHVDLGKAMADAEARLNAEIEGQRPRSIFTLSATTRTCRISSSCIC